MKRKAPVVVDSKLAAVERQGLITSATVDKLHRDYYGGTGVITYDLGFKKETESTLKGHADVISALTVRVKELEKIIKMAGIVEELDTTDVVELPDPKNYRLSFATDDLVTFGEGKKQYVVNKVK